jgi:hypothetical protein
MHAFSDGRETFVKHQLYVDSRACIQYGASFQDTTDLPNNGCVSPSQQYQNAFTSRPHTMQGNNSDGEIPSSQIQQFEFPSDRPQRQVTLIPLISHRQHAQNALQGLLKFYGNERGGLVAQDNSEQIYKRMKHNFTEIRSERAAGLHDRNIVKAVWLGMETSKLCFFVLHTHWSLDSKAMTHTMGGMNGEQKRSVPAESWPP